MRPLIITIPVLLLALTACNTYSVGVGVGSGRSGISVRTYGDTLYSSRGTAYASNREGLAALSAKDYVTAERLFRNTLKDHPGNPDAMFFLGLSLIGQEEREEGFATLKEFKDPHNFRVTQSVHQQLKHSEESPERSAELIIRDLTIARTDGYDKERREQRERLRE